MWPAGHREGAQVQHRSPVAPVSDPTVPHSAGEATKATPTTPLRDCPQLSLNHREDEFPPLSEGTTGGNRLNPGFGCLSHPQIHFPLPGPLALSLFVPSWIPPHPQIHFLPSIPSQPIDSFPALPLQGRIPWEQLSASLRADCFIFQSWSFVLPEQILYSFRPGFFSPPKLIFHSFKANYLLFQIRLFHIPDQIIFSSRPDFFCPSRENSLLLQYRLFNNPEQIIYCSRENDLVHQRK